MSQIICKNLCVGYQNKDVLHNINFSIEEGEYLYILGENGSGKTTLLKTILGIIKPISGKIQIGDGVKRNMIGYLAQQSNEQRDFPATVSEIVLSAFVTKNLFNFTNSLQCKRIAENAMKEMNIYDIRKKAFSILSAGQQQRVLFARALCASKKMIFVDEGETSLDGYSQQIMYEKLYQMNKSGITVVMISHQRVKALKFATHVLEIKNPEEIVKIKNSRRETEWIKQ